MNNEFFNRLLIFLDGRKTKFLAVAGVIIGLASLKGWLDTDISTAILTIMNILAGSASFATDKKLGFRNFEGRRVKTE